MENDRIENLKQKLYSPSSPNATGDDRSPLQDKHLKVESSWQKKPEEAEEHIFDLPEKPKSSVLPWVFALGALLFFAASAVFAWYYVVNKGGVAENVEVLVTGAVSASGGKPETYDITIRNHNSFPIELVDLVVQYPPGTKDASDLGTDVTSYREGLGSIGAGQEVTRTVKIALFGAEKDKKTITAKAQFHVADSNAAYEDEKSVDVLLASAPIEFALDVEHEATVNQKVSLDLSLRSNADSPLHNIVVKGSFPDGFTLLSATPALTDSLWHIDSLDPQATSTIHLEGTFTGDAEAERYFRFDAGLAGTDAATENQIVSLLASSLQKVSLVKPFVGAKLTIDDDDTGTGNVVSGFGKALSAKIDWVNNLDTPITDLAIEAKVEGSVFDRKEVNTFAGFFRSTDNTVVWNTKTNEEFGRIDPGQNGSVNFSFNTLPFTGLERGQNIVIDVSVSAKRPSDSNVPEKITSTERREIKLESAPSLLARSVYYVGPFANSGPLPPRPETHTTYTVYWTLSNTSNDINNATVTGTLPPYVSWTNKVSPSPERVSYDEKTGKVTWNAGTVPAGTGYSRPAREVAFQVDLFPSSNQSNTVPILVQDQELRADDSFTGTTIDNKTQESVTTRISTDPNFNTEFDRVTD